MISFEFFEFSNKSFVAGAIVGLFFLLKRYPSSKKKDEDATPLKKFASYFSDFDETGGYCSPNLMRFASYSLANGAILTIAEGSVTDFVSNTGAIVNTKSASYNLRCLLLLLLQSTINPFLR